MENFVYEYPTKVCFGRGAAAQHLPGLLAGYGPNVLLAYGGGSIRKNGIYDEITGILKAAGKTVTEFSGIMSNPTLANWDMRSLAWKDPTRRWKHWPRSSGSAACPPN